MISRIEFIGIFSDVFLGVRKRSDRMPLIMPDHLVDEWIKLEADPKMLIKESVKDIIAEKA